MNAFPFIFTLPNTLKHRIPPVYGVPSAFWPGAIGLPLKSTEGYVAAALFVNAVGSGASASAGFHPVQYRKMPCRAVSVSTWLVIRSRA